jgi:hypothetical protein
MSEVFAGGNTHDDSGTPANQSEYTKEDEQQIQQEVNDQGQQQPDDSSGDDQAYTG